MNDLAILTTHFNPLHWKLPIANCTIFRESMRPEFRARLFSAEIQFDGVQETDAEVQLTGTADNICWQKEQLLNLLLSRLPASIKYVAWIDRDLIFQNPEWAYEASQMLEGDYFAVQLFASFVRLDSKWNGMKPIPSAGFVHAHKLTDYGVPGGAWMARRDYLDAVQFPNRNIVGSADSLMEHTWRGRSLKFMSDSEYAPALIDWNTRWAERARSEIQGRRIGCVPGTIRHLYHGRKRDRGYHDRHRILRDIAYDPDLHVGVDDQGILELRMSETDRLRIADYFGSRFEDGHHVHT